MDIPCSMRHCVFQLYAECTRKPDRITPNSCECWHLAPIDLGRQNKIVEVLEEYLKFDSCDGHKARMPLRAELKYLLGRKGNG